ncbi:hypothetical protein ALC56_09105 [Trachymyrmex septentrionalis]|uniref:Uncharacterized protein n=1 Tax=Trachymyrmex septentrionalis TaxID=34720 RepID=A0A151JUT7_9HYME|nr:hypothetical protein ALC56_09105 [Trachymyrmex septentrionalis]
MINVSSSFINTKNSEISICANDTSSASSSPRWCHSKSSRNALLRILNLVVNVNKLNDSEIRTYSCDEYYNQSWQGTHSPASKIEDCSKCQRDAAVC